MKRKSSAGWHIDRVKVEDHDDYLRVEVAVVNEKLGIVETEELDLLYPPEFNRGSVYYEERFGKTQLQQSVLLQLEGDAGTADLQLDLDEGTGQFGKIDNWNVCPEEPTTAGLRVNGVPDLVLYHVTDPTSAVKALKTGLSPRGGRAPGDSFPSNPKMMYLTADPEGVLDWFPGESVVLKVEVPDLGRLYPDEDYFHPAAHEGYRYLSDYEKHIADNWSEGWGSAKDDVWFEGMWEIQERHKHHWSKSLKGWRTLPPDPFQKAVAYRGSIGPEYIEMVERGT